MRDLTMSILSGVIGGIVTSVMVLAVSRYWKRVVEPWLEDLVYKGVHIDGMWKTEWVINDQAKSELVVVEQRAHKISGTLTYPEDTKGQGHAYRFEGWFFDNVLTAITQEVGKARLDRGAIVLTIQPGLAIPVMKGLAIWFDGTRPVAVDYKWVRQVS